MSQRITVAKTGDLPPGGAMQVEVEGAPVALFSVDSTIYAIGGSCTHKGAPLGEGELEGNVVTCPWHGSQFDVTTGQVIAPPASSNVPTYKVVVEGEDIQIERG